MDLKQLREICDSATPGPWTINRDFYAGQHAYVSTPYRAHHIYVKYSGKNRYAEAEFISTFNPTLVRELLDRITRLEREGERDQARLIRQSELWAKDKDERDDLLREALDYLDFPARKKHGSVELASRIKQTIGDEK